MKNSDTARENAGILSEIDSAGSKNASYTYGSERTSNTDSTETSYYLYDGRDRQNGEYASNAELGIESTRKNTTGVHGNSLQNTMTNYGYVLVDKDTNEILKFGETLYPA